MPPSPDRPVQAVVLAAGVGSRLADLTANRPTTLVTVAGRPLLDHILGALFAAQVAEVIVVTGHCSDQIREYLAQTHADRNVRVVENVDYASTRDLYDLHLTRQFVTGDLLLMNGDLVFDPQLTCDLIGEPRTAVAIDGAIHDEEALNITFDGTSITGISEQYSADEAYGRSLHIHLLRGDDVDTCFESARRIIEDEGDLERRTEVALDVLFRSGAIRAVPHRIADSTRWVKIGDHDDLDEGELLFSPVVAQLAAKRAFVFDRDGTLSLGDQLIPGAPALLSLLRERGVHCLVMTNNSSRTTAEHAQRLQAMGLAFTEQEICVSTDGAIAYLRARGLERIHWIATDALGEDLTRAGLTYTEDAPEAALLTYDTELTYAKIAAFAHTLRSGVPFFATHPDLVCPTPDGPIPDVGSFLAMFDTATGRRPDRVFGKPDVTHIEAALSRVGVGLQDAVVVGDRLYTDIAVAAANPLLAVLVLTGETTRAAYEDSDSRADLVVSSLGRLAASL